MKVLRLAPGVSGQDLKARTCDRYGCHRKIAWEATHTGRKGTIYCDPCSLRVRQERERKRGKRKAIE